MSVMVAQACGIRHRALWVAPHSLLMINLVHLINTHTHTHTSRIPLPTPPQVKQIPFKSGPAAAKQGVKQADSKVGPCLCVCVCVRVCVCYRVSSVYETPDGSLTP